MCVFMYLWQVCLWLHFMLVLQLQTRFLPSRLLVVETCDNRTSVWMHHAAVTLALPSSAIQCCWRSRCSSHTQTIIQIRMQQSYKLMFLKTLIFQQAQCYEINSILHPLKEPWTDYTQDWIQESGRMMSH
jgi:hypothetical protein